MADDAEAAEAGHRPDDAEILAHERELQSEVESVHLVGPPVPLEELKAQYAANPEFLPNIESLGKRFGLLRRTRPDGNCFYRAYLFGALEQLVGQRERYEAFAARARQSLEFCVSAGYEKVAIEDFFEEFMSVVDKVGAEGATASTVEAAVAESDGYLVCWSRCLTSAYLKQHQDEYAAFLTSHSSIVDFCAKEVDPMNTEADHLQIIALASYLAVPVAVLYLDRSEGEDVAEHRFPSEDAATQVFLLYKPGHYDLIYLRQ